MKSDLKNSSAPENALFLGTFEDETYISALKGLFNGWNTYTLIGQIETLSHLELYCTKRGITKIVSTSKIILSKLLELRGTYKSNPSLDNYQGSVFTYKNLELVFISPLKQLHTVAYGKFIAARFISKLVSKESWRSPTAFLWYLLDPTNVEATYEKFHSAIFIAVDIETFKKNLAIRCIGYTGVFLDLYGKLSTVSVVLPLDSIWALAWMRKFNTLPPDKIFQNGKYDCSYLLRYNAVPTNWFWDTAHFMHSWYAELPKDLAFLNAFFLREVVYWKDLAETNDLQEYYKYNALDTWATANVWISQLLQAPQWAKRNYELAFPLVYPCLLSEMTGLKRDPERLIEARKIIDAQESEELKSLRTILGLSGFNPGSPGQVKQLLKLLGCSDIDSSEEKDLAKAQLLHPLNNFLLGKVLNIRGLRKLKTTYLRLDSDGETIKSTGELKGGSKDFYGRILYSINPHGTDTGRNASREHHFWIGLQVQNVPVGEDGEPSHTKTTICADDGFYIGECDLKQAESRDLAHIVGETNLIAATSSSRDFHSVNASAFFGLPYESIFDDSTGKAKNKPIRNLSKRTNHGAGYNMGPEVFVDTVGLDKVWEAKKLLGLRYYNPNSITEHLLTVFHITYPKIRGPVKFRNAEVARTLGVPNPVENKFYAPNTYYASVAYEITTTRKLVSRAFHHTKYNLKTFQSAEYIESGDWTRYCFGSPDKNKLALNSYVAHCPQSLNARTLNEAYLDVFYKIALPNPKSFRLHAQIHDSILFSYKHGFEYHAESVRQYMEIPLSVRDVFGTTRTFTVPADLKLGRVDKKSGELIRSKYWSDTE